MPKTANELAIAEARIAATQAQIAKLESRITDVAAEGDPVRATMLRGRLLSMTAFLQADLARRDSLRRGTDC
jgi:hypothetical protein